MCTLGRLVVMALAMTAACSAAIAHDFWIRPSNFNPAPGTIVDLDLRVGDAYPGESLGRRADLIERFAALGGEGKPETPVVGLEGRSPAGKLRVSTPGACVVVYRGKPSQVELEAAKFESYLRDKGLEKIIEARKAAGTSASPGREMFSRCAKAVLVCGRGSATGFDLAAGLRLELIPRTDPSSLKPGDELGCTLMRDGQACAGVLVVATCVEDPSVRVQARSGEDGGVALTLGRSGTWVLNAVDMLPAPTGSGADWESLWASLSLRVPGAEPPTQAATDDRSGKGERAR